jgi:hypothetical protein
MKKFKEHIPNIISGLEPKIYNVRDINDVLGLDFVKNFSNYEKFYSYGISIQTRTNINEYKLLLMGLYDWNDEYNGCMNHYVIGHLIDFIAYETKLKNYSDIIAGHKPNCWTRKYLSNKDLLGTDRDEKSKLKILKELGWERDDLFGFANYCDCGFKK